MYEHDNDSLMSKRTQDIKEENLIDYVTSQVFLGICYKGFMNCSIK